MKTNLLVVKTSEREWHKEGGGEKRQRENGPATPSPFGPWESSWEYDSLVCEWKRGGKSLNHGDLN